MSNPANMGTLVGRLARDPKVFENKDGSKKVVFSVYVDRNYTGRDGQRPSDAIPVEAFVSNRVNGLGAYAMVHQGDLVALQTTLQAQTYERAGATVYQTKVVVEDVKFLEPKSVTSARLAGRVAKLEADNAAARATVTAPAMPAAAQTARSMAAPAQAQAQAQQVLMEEPAF